MREPITVPLRWINCPLALLGKMSCASPVTTSGIDETQQNRGYDGE